LVDNCSGGGGGGGVDDVVVVIWRKERINGGKGKVTLCVLKWPPDFRFLLMLIRVNST